MRRLRSIPPGERRRQWHHGFLPKKTATTSPPAAIVRKEPRRLGGRPTLEAANPLGFAAFAFSPGLSRVWLGAILPPCEPPPPPLSATPRAPPPAPLPRSRSP